MTTNAEYYVDAKEAAARLGYRSLHAFHLAYTRLGIPVYRLGRSLRFKPEDLSAALRRVSIDPPSEGQHTAGPRAVAFPRGADQQRQINHQRDRAVARSSHADGGVSAAKGKRVSGVRHG